MRYILFLLTQIKNQIVLQTESWTCTKFEVVDSSRADTRRSNTKCLTYERKSP